MSEKPIKKVRWREGSHHKIDAKVAAAEVQRLMEEHGDKVEATDVLEAAESPRNPLHPEFEWSDTKAAREYRLEQARRLLRGIEIVYVRVENGKRTSTSFSFVSAVHNPDDVGAHYYISTEDGMKQPDQRAEMLANALSELRAFLRKYAVLTELASVFSAIDKTVK